MELKNAVAVCLISLFSATLVVLIARTLDSQAASRLEPQLTVIAEELQALRKQGGIAAAPGAASNPQAEAAADGLTVYYFHSNVRCPTCKAIQSQAQETVQDDFAAQLSSGQMTWKTLNYEQPASAPLAGKFEVQVPVVVLARVSGGRVRDWKRLDEVWALVGDKPAFKAYVRDEIKRMLAAEPKPSADTPRTDPPNIPTPGADAPADATPKIPIPGTETPADATPKAPPPVPVPQ